MTNTGRAAQRRTQAIRLDQAELQAAQARLLARRAAQQAGADLPRTIQITADPYGLFQGQRPIRAAQLYALLCRLADERQPQPTLRRWATETLREIASASPTLKVLGHNGIVHAAMERYLLATTQLLQQRRDLRPWQAGHRQAALIHFHTTRTPLLHLQYAAGAHPVRVAREGHQRDLLRLIGDDAHLQQLSDACGLDVRTLRFVRTSGERSAPTPHLQAPFLMLAPSQGQDR